MLYIFIYYICTSIYIYISLNKKKDYRERRGRVGNGGQDRIMGSKHGHITLNKNVILKNTPLLFL